MDTDYASERLIYLERYGGINIWIVDYLGICLLYEQLMWLRRLVDGLDGGQALDNTIHDVAALAWATQGHGFTAAAARAYEMKQCRPEKKSLLGRT